MCILNICHAHCCIWYPANDQLDDEDDGVDRDDEDDGVDHDVEGNDGDEDDDGEDGGCHGHDNNCGGRVSCDGGDHSSCLESLFTLSLYDEPSAAVEGGWRSTD